MKSFLMFFLVLFFYSDSSFAMYQGYDSSLRNTLRWADEEIADIRESEDVHLRYKITSERLHSYFFSKTGEYPCDSYEFYYNQLVKVSPNTITEGSSSSQLICRKTFNSSPVNLYEKSKLSVEKQAYSKMRQAIVFYMNEREKEVMLPDIKSIRREYLQKKFSNLKKG